ncbi:hypothetical protein [Hyalangium rubrum]|uniref:Uncharacterized protein n=1 Tax=Hyalangium rubrum TaxID=3103134 RepID=A0ABU5H6T9_9BACT|nr:hypothetical protein [Hyalangium sp. s54d21]MDY7229016.1 hypothetical protein [Hyalangium sp. s54d21]
MIVRLMTQSGNKCWALCVLVLGMLGPAVVGAQTPPVPTGGNGFKVGEGRLHPFFDLETRLDTGVGYFLNEATPEPNDLEEGPSSEMVLRLRPGLKLDVPSSKLTFNASARLEYVLYTGLLEPQSTYGSHLEGAADISAHFNPEAPLSFVLSDQFIRSDQTRNVALGAGVLSLFNELRAKMPYRPGGGAVEITPELAWAVEFFSPIGLAVPVGCEEGVCDPDTVDAFDYNNLHAGVDGRWRFLPKTALVLDVDLDLRNYFQGDNPDALLLRSMAGLAGLVSPKIAVTAKVGWGFNFGSTGGNTFLAQLEGTYLYSPTMTFKGGYYRTLNPVAAYGLYRNDRGYVEARALFGGKLVMHGYLAADFLGFYTATAPRSDTLVSVDLGPEYQFKPWLVGAAGYLLSTRSSSIEGTGLNYTRHEVYLRLTLVY